MNYDYMDALAYWRAELEGRLEEQRMAFAKEYERMESNSTEDNGYAERQ